MIEKQTLLITFGDFYVENILRGTITGQVTRRTGKSAIYLIILKEGLLEALLMY